MNDAVRAPLWALPLWAHDDLVHHLGDAGSGPGHSLGLFAFDPGTDGSFEDHLAAIRFNHDAVGIHLGVAFECILILFLISAGCARGLRRIRLLTPLTPLIRRTAFSAVCFWYCHSTWPSSVTQPFLTTTLMCSEETGSWLLIAATASRAISGSGRSIDARHPNLEVVRQASDACHALRSRLGLVLVGVALDKSRQV